MVAAHDNHQQLAISWPSLAGQFTVRVVIMLGHPQNIGTD
jgi:hypothetical protein